MKSLKEKVTLVTGADRGSAGRSPTAMPPARRWSSRTSMKMGAGRPFPRSFEILPDASVEQVHEALQKRGG